MCGSGPDGFFHSWEAIDPPPGKQRQLNKGNLARHVKENQKHLERVAAAAAKAARAGGVGGGILTYLKPRLPTPPPPPPSGPPRLPRTMRVVVSSCGLKLDGMKFSDMEEKREKELKERLEAAGRGEAVVVNLRGFPVVNIPVECPVPDCAKVVWKYNLMPHVCDAHINLYGERNQRWRKRAKPLVAEFVEKLCAVGGRTFGGGKGKKCHKLTDETVEAVGVLLKEMKELVPGDLGIKLAFNLEELARESDSALDAFEKYKGPLRPRAKWSRKEKGSRDKKGVGQQTDKTIETGRDEEVGGGGGGEANEQDEVEEEEGSDHMSISSDEEQEREEEVVVEDESSDSDDSQESEQARRKVGKRKRKK